MIAVGQWKSAAAAFKMAVLFNPKYVQAHSRLSFSYYHEPNSEAAKKEALIALALDPRDMLSNLVLGVISYSRRDPRSSVVYFGHATPLAERNPEALFDLAHISSYNHEREKAIEYVRKAAELKSLSPADRFELGSLYDELGNYQDEVTVFGHLC